MVVQAMSKNKLVQDKRMKLVSVNIWASTLLFPTKKSINPTHFYCSVVDPFNRQGKTRKKRRQTAAEEKRNKGKSQKGDHAFIVTLYYKNVFYCLVGRNTQ